MEGLLYLSFIFLAFVGIPAISFILWHKLGKIYQEWREEQYNKIAREIRYMNFQNNSHNSKEREEMFRQFTKIKIVKNNRLISYLKYDIINMKKTKQEERRKKECENV